MIVLAWLALATAPVPQDQSPPRAPFSQAVRAGDTLYLSGQIGRVPAGADVHGAGFDAAAHEAMDGLGRTLKANGADWSKVVKCTVMLADMADWPRFNAVYAGYFQPGAKLPARSAFGTTGLAFGAAIEVECIAWLGK
jgi:2-iminobutanoate/2-iminopropanoate deaminase